MTSSGFAALMALSQARTQESTRAADSINAERRRKEEARRRQQEEEDRKEREQQAKMLRHHLEEQKREKERQLKREQEREAKLKEMERREEEQRQAMLYGPRKGRERTSRYATSSAASRRPSDDDDDDEGDAGLALTREEKRERRLQLQFSQNATRRSGSSTGTSRAGRRLPGGALNATAQRSQTGGGSANGGSSVRERLTAMPNTLTKLNTVKRDTRTIDEILRDRAKARENKTLEGEEARDFHDWFGSKSKAATTTKTCFTPSPTASGASTPSLLPQQPDTIPAASKKPSSPRPTLSRTHSFSSSLSIPKTASKVSSHGTKFPRPAPLANKITTGLGAHTPTKRARSTPSSYDESESDSEYDRRPTKRAAGPSSGIQDEIWKIFGRDRSKYMSRTVMSDDEDMEADMTALEREELTRFVSMYI